MSFDKNIHPCNYHIIFSPLCLFKISNVFNSVAKYDLSNWIKAFPERKKERDREAPGLWPCIPVEARPEMGQVDRAFEDSPQPLSEDLAFLLIDNFVEIIAESHTAAGSYRMHLCVFY